jgi:hypothetical protein
MEVDATTKVVPRDNFKYTADVLLFDVLDLEIARLGYFILYLCIINLVIVYQINEGACCDQRLCFG